MSDIADSRLRQILDEQYEELLTTWTQQQLGAIRRGTISESDIRAQCAELLDAVRRTIVDGAGTDITTPAWSPVRDILQRVSGSRALQGFTPSETATFVLSLKRPIFEMLRERAGRDADALAAEVWRATDLLDGLALFTADTFLRTREDLITRQQQDMLELSTPVVKLWDGVLALPMIGTLDSSRTQTVMESLLQRIVDTGADVAILDITGVPTVDTLTAQHLLKTVAAARLMGAECIISGIRPQIAQTIVHLGVDLGDVVTKSTLADAFKVALARKGLGVARLRPGGTVPATPGSSSAI